MSSEFDLWRLLAGIALFLFAMTQLELALKALGGRSLALYLREQAGSRLKAVFGGIVTTALLQSSSVVGLMVLAFTGAGLLSLPSALGIVFGSNLGTTFTGWIVATLGFKFEIFELALPLIALGGAALLFGKGRWAQGGRALLGLGLLLLGLQYMKDSVSGLQQLIDIQQLAGLSPWQFLLFGVVVAAVIQSSSATLMLTLAALHADIISLPNAAAVAIGADLGTTTTVLLGALKASAEKKRVALGHVIFNAVTDGIAFALRLPLLALIALLGISDPLYSLVAFHSLFNLVGLVIFIPLTNVFARFLERLVSDDDTHEALYLTEISPAVSEAALAAIERETSRLISRALLLMRIAFDPALKAPAGHMPLAGKSETGEHRPQSFQELYHSSKTLEGEILEFAIRVQTGELEEKDSTRLEQLLSASRRAMQSAKAIKDIHHNLQEFARGVDNTQHRYLLQYRRSMEEYLRQLFALRGTEDQEPGTVSFEDLVGILKPLQLRHNAIHETIYTDIQQGIIAKSLVSTLLNVNRELLNCQLWLTYALGEHALLENQAKDLQQVPA